MQVIDSEGGVYALLVTSKEFDIIELALREHRERVYATYTHARLPASSHSWKVQDCIDKDDYVPAIKQYREDNPGMSLHDAKFYIDSVWKPSSIGGVHSS
ncbi:hypothetical protein UFOVP1528_16 [uncultured Caudovirales phage]|uniref:Uncharacterized protein n=1 Tax=uncultured Caudovirales phage TaxID=2100421 RepID=A0A6J5SEH7_9CAUD|nr:hypothetical protein UFOVP905_11 [uncultured Caudovirales phage]CAB4183274.1 hypothetical protein UFOVP1080_47 [uncultured Caudovirales phage]CAB4197685.1 hypothetical protein UFOVP1321_35 [uncultured Caudovirales phage]CAB4212622.1 hypothetical protein UFOVP1432_28 [uncultured Caudovirales phage]CAB5227227.1 hypothetical protein UFOVP1528_16 [uncultured Caudovirales phage]